MGVFLDDLDSESFDPLMFSTSIVHVDLDQTYLIEVIYGLCQKGLNKDTPKYIALIFRELLKHSALDFLKEHIRQIIEALFSVSETFSHFGCKKDAEGTEAFLFLRGYAAADTPPHH